MAKGWFGIWRIPVGFWLGFEIAMVDGSANQP